MASEVADERLDEILDDDSVLIAYRSITGALTNSRTFLACLFPRRPALHGLTVFTVPRTLAAPLLGVFSSMTFDFLARAHMSNANVTPWAISQVCVPHVGQIEPRIGDMAVALSSTSHSVATACSTPLTAWDESSRADRDAQLDALVAHAYGLTRSEYEVVLNHFRQLGRIEEKPKNFGEYRSKRLRLEAFDRIGGGA
jgi:hypothetical protein